MVSKKWVVAGIIGVGLGAALLLWPRQVQGTQGSSVTFAFEYDGVGRMTVSWPGLSTPYVFTGGQNTVFIPFGVQVTVTYTPTSSYYLFVYFYTVLASGPTVNQYENPLMFDSTANVYSMISAVQMYTG